jgi:GntR family transcriptional regulator / MocR family aminotransferase
LATNVPSARRQLLLDVAKQHDIIPWEDDYETEFAPETPALKSLDEEGRVVYMGSLCKIIAPGLRLGYIVALEPLIRELRALRGLMLCHPPVNNQRATALFLGLGHYKSHLHRVGQALNERESVRAAPLPKYLPDLPFAIPVAPQAIGFAARHGLIPKSWRTPPNRKVF